MRVFRCRSLLIMSLISSATLCPVGAATLTTYSDEAVFLAAIGPSHTREDFDGFAPGTVIGTQVPGVTFSSPNSSLDGYFPIQAFASPGSVSAPNTLAGGFVPGNPGLDQIVVLDFAPAVLAFGFYLSPLAPDSNIVTVRIDFRDATSQTLSVRDTNGNGAEFLGFRSDTRIDRITFRSTRGADGQQGFRQFGLDNLSFSVADTNPPVCAAEKRTVDGVLGFDGTSTDNGPFDSGIESVTLTNATNVTLTCDIPFPASCGSLVTPVPVATWRVQPAMPGLDGQGDVVASDAAGNTCTFTVTFRAFAGGPAESLLVCSDTGIILLVSNPNPAPAGQIVCSSTPPGPGEPVFPPGYEPSPAGDPFPCTVFTIKSPISGPTNTVIKKDGVFEPRLRILYSPFDGVNFQPFTDATQSVEEIATISPDPTRVSGVVKWSQVKIACAIQAELCNGLDDDGDGLVDEGVPLTGTARDCDGDGYPLCATLQTTAVNCAGETVPLIPGAPPDCNDQIGTIHAGSPETCNGLDEDCDGVIDEGSPAGGASCTIPGLFGACANGVTSCASGPMTCVQTQFPAAETCDGLDNDCDGEVDEGQPGGGGACTVPGLLGACATGILSCASGPATCTQTIFPTTETCNGKDDDCDGAVDEAFVFSGYLQPVNQDGSSIFQQRSTIPFKFRLTTCAGQTAPAAVATIEVIPFASRIVGSELEASSTAKPSTGNVYRFDAKANQYIYNLGTKALTPNASYIIRTRIDDGSVHDVVISLK
jgi:putative metal-binding protein